MPVPAGRLRQSQVIAVHARQTEECWCHSSWVTRPEAFWRCQKSGGGKLESPIGVLPPIAGGWRAGSYVEGEQTGWRRFMR